MIVSNDLFQVELEISEYNEILAKKEAYSTTKKYILKKAKDIYEAREQIENGTGFPSITEEATLSLAEHLRIVAHKKEVSLLFRTALDLWVQDKVPFMSVMEQWGKFFILRDQTVPEAVEFYVKEARRQLEAENDKIVQKICRRACKHVKWVITKL